MVQNDILKGNHRSNSATTFISTLRSAVQELPFNPESAS